MQLLDGKYISEIIKNEIKDEVDNYLKAGHRAPHMVAIIVGHNPASATYVASKKKNSLAVGFKSTVLELPETTTEAELIDKIHELNIDESVDGFIVQLPLPKNINENKIIESILPSKDIDGFHPVNLGKMMLSQEAFVPATPFGIMQLLKRYNIETKGKNCVVLGRSNIVGTPMSILLSRNSNPGNCTVTLAHSATQDLEAICKNADIIVAAIGKKHFVTANMVKEGAVIIDVGINRLPNENKIYGDVDFENVKDKCSYISPVPGGVGLMTIVALMMNTLQAYKKNYLNK